jgi:PKD repeat protein
MIKLKITFHVSLLCISILLFSLIQPINAIGVFRNATGTWYLDNNGDGFYNASIDKEYQFGAPNFIPILSDWNGDGRAKIGVYKDGAWYLDYLGEGTWTTNTKAYGFGASGYTPVISDWNGDGRAKIGVYKDGAWYLDYLGEGTWTANTKSYGFGASGYTPVIGDWNGDGRAKIGVYKDGAWYLDYLGEGTWTANTKVYQFGQSGDYPVIIQILPFPVAPVAAFTANVQSGTAPFTVIFTNKSTGIGPLTYAWDFDNDGKVDSTLPSPAPAYTEPGTYSVRLTVTNGVGSDSELKTDYITVAPVPVAPVALFNANAQSGNAPLRIRFTDESTGTAPLSFAWDFNNDGKVDSTIENPAFTYTTAGIYTVKLTVTNTVGSDSETKTDFIEVNPALIAPSAAFTADLQSGIVPLTVTFTNKSTGTGPLSYAWDFNNDGEVDSTLPSPTHTYTELGTYSVKVTVTNGVGSDSELKIDYITVTSVPVAPVAAFTANIQSGNAPLRIWFTDISTGTAPLTYAWDFDNDGEVDSTIQDPSYTYSTAGIYTVKLTVANVVCSDSEKKTDFITVNEAPPDSSHAGVAITFDDNAVENWNAIQDLLEEYDAHVTFFVSSFGGLSESQINTLTLFNENGHEIAFHGAHHTDAQEYLSSHSIDEYLNYEIIPGIALMQNAGFNPVDFAYPYGSEDEALTEVLQGYFLHIRGTDYRETGIPLKDVDSVFYQYGSNQPFINGIGIDDVSYGNSLDDIYAGILRAKEEEKILIFYTHTPVVSNPQVYQITHDRLEKILKNVTENNLNFYKISEIN